MDRTISRWLPVLAVGAVLGIGAIAASTSSPEITNLPMPPLNTTEASTRPPTAEATGLPTVAADNGDGSSFVIPDWITYAAAVLCVLVVAGLIFSLVW